MGSKVVLAEGENKILDILLRVDTPEALRSAYVLGLSSDRQDPDIVIPENLVLLEMTILNCSGRRDASKLSPPKEGLFLKQLSR